MKHLLLLIAVLSLTLPTPAQEPPTTPPPTRPARQPRPPIVLAPDDKPAFPPAPAGFDKKRDNIERGKLETVEYDSKSVGNQRKLVVYTPPGYPAADQTYPVLYLLHGIGGDENEWRRGANVNVLLDNLYADKKILPMIVVMPNGRAQPDDRATGDVFRTAPAFGVFDKDLLGSVIPFVESKYATKTGPENRALAGLSMGGGQTLNFGLANPDTFAWLGAFSAAPNTKPAAQLLPDPKATAQKLKYFWISCGDQDGLFGISQGVHQYCKQNDVPHTWHVDAGGKHDFAVWKNDLYLFTQKIFR